MDALSSLAGQPVIVGAGLAGLTAALALAPQPVVVVTAGQFGNDCASAWSQGGLAAALGGDDSIDLHVSDTLAAGDGLCDRLAVERILAAAPAAVQRLIDLGVRFTRDSEDSLILKLEAAHSRRRVVNAGGDATGAEIMRGIVEAVRQTPSITVLEHTRALELLVGDGSVEGLAIIRNGTVAVLPTRAVILATGGAGGLWQHTTNPPTALGQGLGMAARAGATLADLEFVQFHPTAIDIGLDPMPLASEVLRGEGGILINDLGIRFMAGLGRAELEPRDIVARAVWQQIEQGHRVFLDTRQALGARLPERFPTVVASCRAAGLDPVLQPIPIRPAVHYHMGGVVVDACGRTDIEGLWACGEVARTGLHGANRLASNSLPEAVVTGEAVAADVAGRILSTSLKILSVPPFFDDATGLSQVREIMSAHTGVLRDAHGLQYAVDRLASLACGKATVAMQAATVSLMIAAAALLRTESRGGHARTDCTACEPGQASSRSLRLSDAFAVVDLQRLKVG